MFSRRIYNAEGLASGEKLTTKGCLRLLDRGASSTRVDVLQDGHEMIRCLGPGCRLGQARRQEPMGSAIASDSGASAPSPIALTNVRTGLGADAIATALIENLHCLLGKLPQHATRNDWYMAPRLHGSRPHDGALYRDAGIHCRNEHSRQGRCISFGGVPDRTASGQQPRSISGSGKLSRKRCRESGKRSIEPSGSGGGARVRQWRSWPPGRVLHGLAGDAQRSCHRLRHPLRVRHLRSGDS